MVSSRGFIENTLTKEVVVGNIICTPFGERFHNASVSQSAHGRVSRLPFGVCPSEGISSEDIRKEYSGSVVVHMDGYSKTCYPDFFEQTKAYEDARQLNASAIVYLDTIHSVPGVWYGYHSKKNSKPLVASIPFLHCVQPSVDDSNGALTSLVTKWKYQGLHDSLYLDTYSSNNEWNNLFRSSEYQAVFRVLLPVIYLFLSLYYLLILLKYLGQVTNRKQQPAKRGKKRKETLVMSYCVVLGLELAISSLLLLYFIVDGHWSVYGSTFKRLRSLVFGMFILTSASSSIVLGSRFEGMKRRFTNRQVKRSLRHYIKSYVLYLSSFSFLTLEIIAAIFRDTSDLKIYANFAAVLVTSAILVWFVYESCSFSYMLKTVVDTKMRMLSETQLSTSGGEDKRKPSRSQLRSMISSRRDFDDQLSEGLKKTRKLMEQVTLRITLLTMTMTVLLSIGVYSAMSERRFFTPLVFSINSFLSFLFRSLVGFCKASLIRCELKMQSSPSRRTQLGKKVYKVSPLRSTPQDVTTSESGNTANVNSEVSEGISGFDRVLPPPRGGCLPPIPDTPKKFDTVTEN